MIVTTLSLLLFITFFFLSSIHVYWVFGGEWGYKQAVPTKENGEINFKPGVIATIIVAGCLLFFGLFYLLKSNLIPFNLPEWLLKTGYWVIPSIFIIRVIGDFKYVGVFKKVKNTAFAKADTKIFIPLCLCIGSMGIILQLLQ